VRPLIVRAAGAPR